MNILGLSITRTKQTGPLQPVDTRAGWWRIIHESFTGAWQQNVEITLANVLTHPTVFACISLIASDIGKMRLRLVEQDADGIWTETESAAFSPVLRKPNHYQTRIKFFEQWMISKLAYGNTYVLKQRDSRTLVTAMYVLDPQRVIPLVGSDGSVFYQLKRDDLSNQPQEDIIAPASEIIHDVCVPLYHPLVGVSPIHACGLAAVLGLKIQSNSASLFNNGANPGGVLTAPGAITAETADRLKTYWDENYTGENVGKVAVLGDGLKFERMAQTAVDTQLTEQWRATAEAICSCFHVPAYMVGVGPPPSYANIEPLNIQYYSQALQNPIECIEILLDEGMGLDRKIEGRTLGTEFDLDDLLRMDTASMVTAEANAIGAGFKAPNESRKRANLKPVKGGDSPMMQQQQFSLEALAERDQEQPFAKPPAGAPAAPAEPEADEETDEKAVSEMLRKALGLAA